MRSSVKRNTWDAMRFRPLARGARSARGQAMRAVQSRQCCRGGRSQVVATKARTPRKDGRGQVFRRSIQRGDGTYGPKRRQSPRVWEAGKQNRLSASAEHVRMTKRATARKTNRRASCGFTLLFSPFRDLVGQGSRRVRAVGPGRSVVHGGKLDRNMAPYKLHLAAAASGRPGDCRDHPTGYESRKRERAKRRKQSG